ncbi:MAG: DUF4386 domain-containing protein [Chloroflexota bacterium]
MQSTLPTNASSTYDALVSTGIQTPQLYARLAGGLYLIITVAAIFAHFYMPSQLIVADDPAATTSNIANALDLFRFAGVGGELIILLSEVILSILLYALLKPVNRTLSLLAATARLVMTAVHGINLLNYGFILLLLGNPVVANAFDAEQTNAMVSLFLEAHSFGFTLGIAFLVIHVVALGVLIFQSGYFPRLLGVLFLLAGLGYLVETTAILFVDGYTETPGLVAFVIAAPELAFPIWLLVRGVNRTRWAEKTSSAN